MERRLIRPADLVLVLAAAALAAGLLLWQSGGESGSCVAVIEENGAEVQRIDLGRITEPEEIDLGDPLLSPLAAQFGFA